MNRLPSELRSTPPSPRTDSVTRMPFTDGGQTMPGGVELHELHVDQRRPREQRQRVPVAGVLPGVRRHLEGLADAAGGQNHRGCLQDEEPAGLALVAEDARDRLLAGGVIPAGDFRTRVTVHSWKTFSRAS